MTIDANVLSANKVPAGPAHLKQKQANGAKNLTCLDPKNSVSEVKRNESSKKSFVRPNPGERFKRQRTFQLIKRLFNSFEYEKTILK